MVNVRDRILIVENDPIISDLVGRQALQSMGYQVKIVGDATTAIPQTIQFNPDILIVDMNLPGLSGKDFLVALNSQRINTPVIVIAKKGMENDIIQAFRLGASDYLLWPLRDAEVLAAVERVLKQVHERRERDHLAGQLQQINQELQNRVRELTTIFSVGKAVTSITDQRVLFDRIVEGAIKVTQADMGWFLLRDERTNNFVLVGYRNLPSSLAGFLNLPWDDGISSLVALSGETLSINGEPLKRFKVATLGQSALIVPIKGQKQVIGLLVVVRKASKAFNTSDQNLLEAVADYASISLVNARLFRALEERAQTLQQMVDNAQAGEKFKNDILQNLSRELQSPLAIMQHTVDSLEGTQGALPPELRSQVPAARNSFDQLTKITEALAALQTVASSRKLDNINLNELARNTISRFQRIAQQSGVSLVTELSAEPVLAYADSSQITQVFDALISNAIKYSLDQGQVTVRVDKTSDQLPHVMVKDNGSGMQTVSQTNGLDTPGRKTDVRTRQFGGLGISLSLAKEIVAAHGGKIWVDSKPGQGSVFHFSLPRSK